MNENKRGSREQPLWNLKSTCNVKCAFNHIFYVNSRNINDKFL